MFEINALGSMALRFPINNVCGLRERPLAAFEKPPVGAPAVVEKKAAEFSWEKPLFPAIIYD